MFSADKLAKTVSCRSTNFVYFVLLVTQTHNKNDRQNVNFKWFILCEIVLKKGCDVNWTVRIWEIVQMNRKGSQQYKYFYIALIISIDDEVRDIDANLVTKRGKRRSAQCENIKFKIWTFNCQMMTVLYERLLCTECEINNRCIQVLHYQTGHVQLCSPFKNTSLSPKSAHYLLIWSDMTD